MKKFINILLGNYREDDLWDNIRLYWDAYDDYCQMRKESGVAPDKSIPYYAVWPKYLRPWFLFAVVFWFFAVCALSELPLPPYTLLATSGLFINAVYLLHPEQYQSYRKRHANLVYIHFYTDTMARRLEQDVARLTAEVQPWREQKAKATATPENTKSTTG